ncbi:MAG: hypothetical protein A3J38_02545 [Gammaproteobacteria bacterium RIFCSPHIGHO2_12_FULL_45_9]|nr:MAG: hypothetical protein A3J38_02545 [Gammaproteobacteria bacterium RIFCSPHIGHO2_12_FULL_45_9]
MTTKRIGILATGTELVEGQIENSNARQTAQQFVVHDLEPGLFVTVGDSFQDIVEATRFLSLHHDAIITIGGLGPTSDDITRQAVCEAFNLPLHYHPEAWDWLCEHLTQKGYTVPDNNQQQAYFPEHATLFRNWNGTAAATHFTASGKDVFLLPGPPAEYFPFLEQQVLPYLKQNGYIVPRFRRSWMLQNVSESHIAEILEPLWQAHPEHQQIHLGFRVQKPRLEVKLRASTEALLTALADQFDPILTPHLVPPETPL